MKNQLINLKNKNTKKHKLFLLSFVLILSLSLMIFSNASAVEDETSQDETSPDETTESEVAYPQTPTKVAYLTFDDGPSQSITPAILDLLQQENIKATFFVLPIRNRESVYRRIIDEGHEMGNHSSSHNYNKLYTGSVETFINDVRYMHNTIYDNYGYTMKSFRFPGGPFGYPSSVFEERRVALSNIGYREFAWHIDSRDFSRAVKNSPPEALVEKIIEELRKLRNRDHVIILFHDTDTNQVTLNALPGIIAALRERGFTFDTVYNFPISEAEARREQERLIMERNARIYNLRLRQMMLTLADESLD